MKSSPILERVKEMTRQAREREAEKLLDVKLVKDAIREAAGQGYSRVVFAPQKPLDLTKTDVALATVAELEKEGFHIQWEVRIQTDSTSLKALVVSW